jgi:hypothetical protein
VIQVAKHNTVRREPPWVVYVGRTQRVGRQYRLALYALGNPYPVSMGRAKCIEEYRNWLKRKIRADDYDVVTALDRLLELYSEHGKLVLCCHCHPLSCHADVIKACLEWMKEAKRDQ